MCRYQSKTYLKRINDRIAINRFLINKINKHKEASFPFSQVQLENLRYDELHEIVIAAINKKIAIMLTEGQDYDNLSDSKFAIVRKNGTNQTLYSAAISSCATKKFIQATVYEPIQGKFYFFAFQPWAGSHSVEFDPITGDPLRVKKNTVTRVWATEVKTIEDLATVPIFPLAKSIKELKQQKKKFNDAIFA